MSRLHLLRRTPLPVLQPRFRRHHQPPSRRVSPAFPASSPTPTSVRRPKRALRPSKSPPSPWISTPQRSSSHVCPVLQQTSSSLPPSRFATVLPRSPHTTYRQIERWRPPPRRTTSRAPPRSPHPASHLR